MSTTYLWEVQKNGELHLFELSDGLFRLCPNLKAKNTHTRPGRLIGSNLSPEHCREYFQVNEGIIVSEVQI